MHEMMSHPGQSLMVCLGAVCSDGARRNHLAESVSRDLSEPRERHKWRKRAA